MSNSGKIENGKGAVEDRYTTMGYYDLLPPAIRLTLSELNLNFGTKRIFFDYKNGHSQHDIIYNLLRCDLVYSQEELLAKYGVDHPGIKY